MKHLKRKSQLMRKKYRDLEMSVLSHLRDAVLANGKPIPANIFDYKELGIVNDTLVFFDYKGYQYSLFAEASLEDLIELLNSYANQ